MRHAYGDADHDAYGNTYPNSDPYGNVNTYSNKNTNSDPYGGSYSYGYSRNVGNAVGDADLRRWRYAWSVDAGCACSH